MLRDDQEGQKTKKTPPKNKRREQSETYVNEKCHDVVGHPKFGDLKDNRAGRHLLGMRKYVYEWSHVWFFKLKFIKSYLCVRKVIHCD